MSLRFMCLGWIFVSVSKNFNCWLLTICIVHGGWVLTTKGVFWPTSVLFPIWVKVFYELLWPSNWHWPLSIFICVLSHLTSSKFKYAWHQWRRHVLHNMTLHSIYFKFLKFQKFGKYEIIWKIVLMECSRKLTRFVKVCFWIFEILFILLTWAFLCDLVFF